MKSQKIFLGVAWPYVNGDLHIGHLAGYLLPADICARYHRLQGRDVLMVSGSDCFGTPITLEADKRKISPQQLADEYHEKDTELFLKTLQLSFDLYTRTDHPHHAKVVQDFFLKFIERELIVIDTTQQYYSSAQKRFLPDRYVIGVCPHCKTPDTRSDQCDACGKLIVHGELIDPRSTLDGGKVGLRETEHYFINWPKLQSEIKTYVDRVSSAWKPWVKATTEAWLKEGLKPRAITRDIDWGVAIPDDRIPAQLRIKGSEHKRFYVWFDAVIGYFSASKLWGETNSKQWEHFWGTTDTFHYYFMGKDNLVFHTLFWPGQLMTYDSSLRLPDLPSINMFLDLEGKKFSKSRGVSLGIKEMVEQYGNDRVRFYLTRIMPETMDSSFSLEEFKEKINTELVGNLGNFIHRTRAIAQGVSGDPELIESPVRERIKRSFSTIKQRLDQCEFRAFLEELLTLSSFGNKYFDERKVWQLKKNNPQEFAKAIASTLYLVYALGVLMEPLLFEASTRLLDALAVKKPSLWPQLDEEWRKFEQEIALIDTNAKPVPLFQKID